MKTNNKTNPFLIIKTDQNYTINEFALAMGLSPATIEKLLTGSQRKIPKKAKQALYVLNYSVDEIEQDYQDFREQKRKDLLN